MQMMAGAEDEKNFIASFCSSARSSSQILFDRLFMIPIKGIKILFFHKSLVRLFWVWRRGELFNSFLQQPFFDTFLYPLKSLFSFHSPTPRRNENKASLLPNSNEKVSLVLFHSDSLRAKGGEALFCSIKQLNYIDFWVIKLNNSSFSRWGGSGETPQNRIRSEKGSSRKNIGASLWKLFSPSVFKRTEKNADWN